MNQEPAKLDPEALANAWVTTRSTVARSVYLMQLTVPGEDPITMESFPTLREANEAAVPTRRVVAALIRGTLRHAGVLP